MRNRPLRYRCSQSCPYSPAVCKLAFLRQQLIVPQHTHLIIQDLFWDMEAGCGSKKIPLLTQVSKVLSSSNRYSATKRSPHPPVRRNYQISHSHGRRRPASACDGSGHNAPLASSILTASRSCSVPRCTAVCMDALPSPSSFNSSGNRGIACS